MTRGKPSDGQRTWQNTENATQEQMRLADEFAKEMAMVLRDAQRDGATLKNQIAAWLNKNGYRTRLGKPWSRVAVKRLFVRLETLYRLGWKAD